MDAVAGGGEACSVAADSAVVPGAVYSSEAPQECINIHNSDHLATGKTRGLPQRTLASSSLSSEDCRFFLLFTHKHTHTHTLKIPFFKVRMRTYAFTSTDTNNQNISSFVYATKIYSANTWPQPFISSSPGRWITGRQKRSGYEMPKC